ncbi:hypothetical protein [Pseudomonas sp. NPDC096950]|uniref:hypothetical protein n=1 Tax=Pseudomonas sp. NPDC096950 TaxID=3364485 RepID=UPI00383B6710
MNKSIFFMLLALASMLVGCDKMDEPVSADMLAKAMAWPCVSVKVKGQLSTGNVISREQLSGMKEACSYTEIQIRKVALEEQLKAAGMEPTVNHILTKESN